MLVLGFAAWLWTHQHKTLTNALREAEAARLMLKNQIVESQETQAGLRSQAMGLLDDNKVLRAKYESALAAAPGSRVEHVESFTTEPVTLQEQEEEDPPEEESPTPVRAEDHTPLSHDRELEALPVHGHCYLAPGDVASVEVSEVTLKTQEGNLLVAGSAAVWREGEIRKKIFESGFSSKLSKAETQEAPQDPRWGAEVLGACAATGCGLGAGVLLPPMRLLGLRLEARAGVLLGPALQATAGVGLRF